MFWFDCVVDGSLFWLFIGRLGGLVDLCLGLGWLWGVSWFSVGLVFCCLGLCLYVCRLVYFNSVVHILLIVSLLFWFDCLEFWFRLCGLRVLCWWLFTYCFGRVTLLVDLVDLLIACWLR